MLRVGPPDVITVTDGRGTVARCAVIHAEGPSVVAEVIEREHRRPPLPRLVVYQGAAKGTKVDAVIQALAELGVAELWAYSSERSVVRWEPAKVARLTERWRAIARAAAKQARNPHLLTAGGGLSFAELTRRVASEPFAVVLWEEASLPLRAVLVEGPERVALVVGPEGGLTRGEAETLAAAGAQLASLGPFILRTEHAPLAAGAALLYHYGLLG